MGGILRVVEDSPSASFSDVGELSTRRLHAVVCWFCAVVQVVVDPTLNGGGKQELQAGAIPDGSSLQSKKTAPSSRGPLVLKVLMDDPPGSQFTGQRAWGQECEEARGKGARAQVHS